MVVRIFKKGVSHCLNFFGLRIYKAFIAGAMKAGACVCRLPLPVSFLCAGVFVGHRFHLTKLWKYLKFPNVCVPGGYFLVNFLNIAGSRGKA